MLETYEISSLALYGGSEDGYGSLPTDFGVVVGTKKGEKGVQSVCNLGGGGGVQCTVMYSVLNRDRVTISAQWDYWKARSQKAISSSVNSSWNAETPGRRRSHYSKEQQDDPTRMRDGVRIRRKPSGYQENNKRKNQGQPGYFCLKARGYDRRPKTYCKTSLECVRGMFYGYTEEKRKLNGKLASLNRFLAKSAEKSLPLFRTLKKCTKKSNFHWTAKTEEAFKQMKQLIAELPMLVAPMEKEELLIYLAAAKETGIKRPINKLHINGKTSASLEEDSSDTLIEIEEELHKPWILYTDGSSCMDGFGAGLILTNPEGMEFTYALRFRLAARNNKAEYEALIARLRIAKQMGVKNLQANVDSQLVANQVNGTYVAKEADMIRYLEKVRMLTSGFKAFSIRQVPKTKNGLEVYDSGLKPVLI
nr:reverse transcriptase domain-containing protein [Tanacetum cinerariifolium]